MRKGISFGPIDTIGLDVGDRYTAYCEVRGGRPIAQDRIATGVEHLKRFLAQRSPCRVVVEVGKHSPWMFDVLRELPFESIFVNAAKLMTLHELKHKTDRLDARYLASRGSLNDAKIIESRVEHRELGVRAALAVIRFRDLLVRTRTKIVNSVRGTVCSFGGKLPKTSPRGLLKPEVIQQIPPVIFDAIEPMLGSIKSLNDQIAKLEKTIEKLAESKYRQALQLAAPKGVGPITALAFLLVIGDPKRFKNGRVVASYLGLTAGVRQSGDSSEEIGITKEGDELLRRLLLQCAHSILGPRNTEDSDLRRFGLQLAASDPKNGKKRAVVAVARKLAVVLFHLLATGEEYQPLFKANRFALGGAA